MAAERLPDDDLDRTLEHWLDEDGFEVDDDGEEPERVGWIGGVPPLPDWPHTNGL
jgi:hypothetical protein